MNNTIGHAIRRLTNIFLTLLLIISAVAAYVQVSDRAFFNGPLLAESETYNANGRCPRSCAARSVEMTPDGGRRVARAA